MHGRKPPRHRASKDWLDQRTGAARSTLSACGQRRAATRCEQDSVVGNAIRQPGAVRANRARRDGPQRSGVTTTAFAACRQRTAATTTPSARPNQPVRSAAGNTDNHRDCCRSARNGALSGRPFPACGAFQACGSWTTCRTWPLTLGMAHPCHQHPPANRVRTSCQWSASTPAAAQRPAPTAASCVERIGFAPPDFILCVCARVHACASVAADCRTSAGSSPGQALPAARCTARKTPAIAGVF
jgi:hypothetical protein